MLEPAPGMEEVMEAVSQSFGRHFMYKMTSRAASEITNSAEERFDRQ